MARFREPKPAPAQAPPQETLTWRDFYDPHEQPPRHIECDDDEALWAFRSIRAYRRLCEHRKRTTAKGRST